MGNGELRDGRGANGQVTIRIPTKRMAHIAEGVCRKTESECDFMGTGESDIADHFNQQGYAILRPIGCREYFWGGGNPMVNDAMVVYLGNLVYRCDSFNQHLHIEACPFGSLIEQGR